MADTKRGRLGVAVLEAATNTSVYAVTDGCDATVDIIISNFIGSKEFAEIDVAIVDGAVGDIAAEDYIVDGHRLRLGDIYRLEDISMSADECVVVKSSVAGLTVRVAGVEQDAAVNSSPALQIKKITSQALAFGDFTDNEDTTGYIDFDEDLPAGAIVLGWRAAITTGFVGDTSAVMQVGVSGDVDAFSADTTQSCLTDSSVAGSASLAATAALAIASDVTPRVTVTGAADFSSISAGSMVVEIDYIID